jgi:peptidoglycan/LPS O-acetylase OafA/YrhL
MSIEQAIIPLFVLALPLAIIILSLRFVRQQTDARYRTLLQLAEKGADLPLDVLAEHRRPQDDRRRAIVLLSGGLGLILCLLALPVQTEHGQSIGEIWGVGLLPVMMGLGYLLNWWLETRAGASDGS